MKIDKDLVVIVTGGCSGLGKETVQYLRREKVNVVVADLDEKQGKVLQKWSGAQFFKTNVTIEEQVKALVNFTVEKFKRIDVVVNSAGISRYERTISSKGVLSSESVEKIFKVNVIGTLNVCKHAAKQMSQQQLKNGQRGLIINVASTQGFQGVKGQVGYSASKGAVIGMTLPMARDLGKFKIRVMTIAPGLFITPMTSKVDKKINEIMENSSPLGRLGLPSDFAIIVQTIIQNPFATGTTWRIDGGSRNPYI